MKHRVKWDSGSGAFMGIHMGGGSAVEANSAPRWGQMVADVRKRRKIRPQEGAGDEP